MKRRNIVVTVSLIATLCVGIGASSAAIRSYRTIQHNRTRTVEYVAFAENICGSAGGTASPTVLSAQTQTDPSSPNASGEQTPQTKRMVPVEFAEYVVAPCHTKRGMRYVLLHFRGTDVCDGWHVNCTPIETLDRQWTFALENDIADVTKDMGVIETDAPNHVELFTAREAYDNLTANLREAEKDARMRSMYWLPTVPDPDIVKFPTADLAQKPNPNDDNDRLVADDASYHRVIVDENLLHRTVYRACLDRPKENVLRYEAQDVDQNERTTTFRVSCGNTSTNVVSREITVTLPHSFDVTSEISNDSTYVQVHLR